MFDILEDCLFVQAHCTHEISNRPYSPSSPVPLPDEFELLIQGPPRVLFDNLGHLRNNVLTLSPFSRQFRGFLKVDRKPACRDHLSILKTDSHFNLNPEKTASPFDGGTTISIRSMLNHGLCSLLPGHRHPLALDVEFQDDAVMNRPVYRGRGKLGIFLIIHDHGEQKSIVFWPVWRDFLSRSDHRAIFLRLFAAIDTAARPEVYYLRG